MSFDFVYGILRHCLERKRPSAPGPNSYDLLAISPDTRFLATLLYVAGAYGWRVRWSTSIAGTAIPGAGRSIPVVVYDSCLPSEDWNESIARLKLRFKDSCLVMAARSVSEDLWRQALDRGVYDVVSRSENTDHLAATVRFAFAWGAAQPPAGTAHATGCQSRSGTARL